LKPESGIRGLMAQTMEAQISLTDLGMPLQILLPKYTN
jgi:hypothetical protein